MKEKLVRINWTQMGHSTYDPMKTRPFSFSVVWANLGPKCTSDELLASTNSAHRYASDCLARGEITSFEVVSVSE